MRLVAIVLIGCLIRFAIHSSSFATIAEGRFEISSPITSFKRIREGGFLLEHHQSPYEGNVLHAPPLLLAALVPLASSIWTLRVLLVLVDVINALILRKLVQEYHSKKSEASPKFSVILPDLLLAWYLLNPITMLSSCGLSWSNISHMFLLFSLLFARRGMWLTSSAFVALASYLEIHWCVLIFAMVGLLLQAHSTSSKRKVIALFSVISALSCFAGLHYLSYIALESWSYLEHTVWFSLTVGELTPNAGVFWYFFTEIFERFRSFFLFLFQAHILVYMIPLTYCFRNEPFFLSYAVISIVCIFKSYPTIADTMFALTLLLSQAPFIPKMRSMVIPLFLMCFSCAVGLVMWYLWIHAGSGNANFYYFQSLIFVVCNCHILLEAITAARKQIIEKKLN